MKRALTGIAAASVVLGMSVPTVFAANYSNATWHQETIQIGSTTLGFKGFDALYAGTQTDYMPIYYLIEMLQKDGYQASWNGINKVFSITTPSGVKVDMSQFTSPGQGTASIYLNGQLVQMTDSVVMKDPASGVNTTYMPVYFLLKVLSAIGAASQSNWNGTTETLTLQAPSVMTSGAGLSALTVSGQTIGSGTATNPYINETGTSETVSTMLMDSMGNPVANATLDVTLVGGTTSPTVQQGNMYQPISSSTSNGETTYTTSVTTDSNGKVSFTVSGEGVYQLTVAGTNGYSSDTQSTYIGMANDNPILSPSTMSTGFSSASNSTAGLVPVTVTLPESNNAPAANQEVTFYLVNNGGLDGMFTNAQGQSIGASAVSTATNGVPSTAIAYTTYTNSDGQATVYVNAYEAGTATVYVAEGGNGTGWETGVTSTVTYSAPSTTTVTSAAGLAVGTADFTNQNSVVNVNSVYGVSDSDNVYVAPLSSTANQTDAMLTGNNVTYTLNFASGQNLSSISLDAGTSNAAVNLTTQLPTSATSASTVQVEAEYGTNNYTWWVNGVELMNGNTPYTTTLPVFGFQASAAGTVNITSGSAKATAAFVGAPDTGTYTSYLSPNTISVSTVGGSTNATFTVLDKNGNPVPNTSVPISYSGSLNDLWLTAVNGTSLSEYVTGSNTTEPTPIPLYSVGSLGYSSVSIPGLVAWNSSNNTFNVETGSNGQVTLSFATSGVPYWNTTNGTTYGIAYSSAPNNTPTSTTYTYTYFGNSTQPNQGVLYIGNSQPTNWTSVGSINW